MEVNDWVRIGIAAAAVIGSGGVAALLKLFFDWRSLHTAHKQRVKEALLKTIVEYNKKYYLPMLCETEGLAYSLEEKNMDTRIAFMYLCRYSSRRRDILKKLPGYFLEKRAVEALVAKLETAVYDDFTTGSTGLRPIDWSGMATLISADDTLRDIEGKLSAPPLPAALRRYKKWRETPDIVDKTSIHCRCYIKFLEYEINKTLQDWYGKKPKLILTKGQKEETKNLIGEMYQDTEVSSDEVKDLKHLLNEAEVLPTE